MFRWPFGKSKNSPHYNKPLDQVPLDSVWGITQWEGLWDCYRAPLDEYLMEKRKDPGSIPWPICDKTISEMFPHLTHTKIVDGKEKKAFIGRRPTLDEILSERQGDRYLEWAVNFYSLLDKDKPWGGENMAPGILMKAAAWYLKKLARLIGETFPDCSDVCDGFSPDEQMSLQKVQTEEGFYQVRYFTVQDLITGESQLYSKPDTFQRVIKREKPSLWNLVKKYDSVTDELISTDCKLIFSPRPVFSYCCTPEYTLEGHYCTVINGVRRTTYYQSSHHQGYQSAFFFISQYKTEDGGWKPRYKEEEGERIHLYYDMLKEMDLLGDGVSDVKDLLLRTKRATEKLYSWYKKEVRVNPLQCSYNFTAMRLELLRRFEEEYDRLQVGEDEEYREWKDDYNSREMEDEENPQDLIQVVADDEEEEVEEGDDISDEEDEWKIWIESQQ